MDKHHFGSIIMSALSVHLQSGMPLEEIQSLLKKIKTNLEQDKINSDRAFTKEQDACGQMLSNFESNIDLHSKSLESNRNSLKSDKEIFGQTLASYKQLEKDLDDNIAKYEKNNAKRDLENSEFLKKLREHEDSISTTNEAISLVEHLKAGTSFVQLRGRFDKVKTR
jgi:DNA-binding transcriptional MerR regulator